VYAGASRGDGPGQVSDTHTARRLIDGGHIGEEGRGTLGWEDGRGEPKPCALP